jgi:hypothetical protein
MLKGGELYCKTLLWKLHKMLVVESGLFPLFDKSNGVDELVPFGCGAIEFHSRPNFIRRFNQADNAVSNPAECYPGQRSMTGSTCASSTKVFAKIAVAIPVFIQLKR